MKRIGELIVKSGIVIALLFLSFGCLGFSQPREQPELELINYTWDDYMYGYITIDEYSKKDQMTTTQIAPLTGELNYWNLDLRRDFHFSLLSHNATAHNVSYDIFLETDSGDLKDFSMTPYFGGDSPYNNLINRSDEKLNFGFSKPFRKINGTITFHWYNNKKEHFEKKYDIHGEFPEKSMEVYWFSGGLTCEVYHPYNEPFPMKQLVECFMEQIYEKLS